MSVLWTAVAKRSDDTAYCALAEMPKRRGAPLPASVQIHSGNGLLLVSGAIDKRHKPPA